MLFSTYWNISLVLLIFLFWNFEVSILSELTYFRTYHIKQEMDLHVHCENSNITDMGDLESESSPIIMLSRYNQCF